ncbi:MAG: trehalose-phosphatase [Actinomycetota bacterium]|nr:trehalose-phosphatase [Actinomycetota bacterium]
MAADLDVLGPLRSSPATSAVLLDFDGTLAPIVERPASARPLAGVTDAIRALHGAGYGLAVVSGRPAPFLAEHLPTEIVLVGLYGLERVEGGVLVADPVAAEWQPVVDGVVERAVAELGPDVDAEHKGLSLTLHFRRHPERADAVEAWATDAAAATGLVRRPAKMSLELHPPVGVDKGTVLDGLLAGRTAAVFIGDDIGDLPAFDAMDRFAASGGHAVKVLVRTSETAAELEGRADLEVEGPDGALALLRSLSPPR